MLQLVCKLGEISLQVGSLGTASLQLLSQLLAFELVFLDKRSKCFVLVLEHAFALQNTNSNINLIICKRRESRQSESRE